MLEMSSQTFPGPAVCRSSAPGQTLGHILVSLFLCPTQWRSWVVTGSSERKSGRVPSLSDPMASLWMGLFVCVFVALLMFVCHRYLWKGTCSVLRLPPCLPSSCPFPCWSLNDSVNRASLSPASFLRKLFWYCNKHPRQSAYRDGRST